MNKEILDKIEKMVEKELVGLKDSGHNIDHVLRVYNNALLIAKYEKKPIDQDVLKLAALLHDIGGPKEQSDPTGNTDHAVESAKMADAILRKFDISEEKINHIKDCIISHRYKTNNEPKTIEAKILFDADKVDALGAIGVARQFNWVGRNGAYIFKEYDVEKYIKENMTAKEKGRIKDKSRHSPQIEYELKIKHLKKKMFTKGGKAISRDRFKFYIDFMARLKKEIQGDL